MSLSRCMTGQTRWGFPRPRGDEPNTQPRKTRGLMFSPPARG